MDLKQILSIYAEVDDPDVEAFKDASETVRYDKNHFIVTQGKRDDFLYLTVAGIFRVSCIIDGVEDTLCFGIEGDAFMSFHCYYAHEPSQFSCIAMSPVEMYRISFSNLEKLINTHPRLMQVFKCMLAEELYLLERRYVYFNAKDAYNRFCTFVTVRPDILKVVPPKYIAQYLKVRQETIYRIRARYLRSRT